MSKQAKLDRFPSEAQKKPSSEKKQVIITNFDSTLVWDDLILIIGFKLVPNKIAFSKIKVDLWFDQEKAKSVLFDILHSFSSTNEFTLKVTLDLKGTPSGTHFLKAEIYEFMFSKKKQSRTKKEIKIEYTPQTKIANLREIPIVRKIEGEGIVVISDNEKQIYREMKETRRKELASKREE